LGDNLLYLNYREKEINKNLIPPERKPERKGRQKEAHRRASGITKRPGRVGHSRKGIAKASPGMVARL